MTSGRDPKECPIQQLKAEGVVEVEGFPRRQSLADRLHPGEVRMGPARLFTSGGFEIVDTRANILPMRLRIGAGSP